MHNDAVCLSIFKKVDQAIRTLESVGVKVALPARLAAHILATVLAHLTYPPSRLASRHSPDGPALFNALGWRAILSATALNFWPG